MKQLSSLLLLTVLCCQSFAQTKHPALTIGAPDKNGFSAERLQRVDKIIQQYIDSGWIAGAITIIAKNSNIVYHKALGYDDKSQNKPLQKDAIFRIASQTKAITSVAVMQLFETGKLLLDDPISRYIPEFRRPVVLDQYKGADTTYTTIPAKREITIRDLLTHTSGINYAQIGSGTSNAIYYKAGVVGGIGLRGGLLADNIKKLATLPLMHQPGERWTYGLNTDVLGYLVEVISGMSLDAYFKKNIFEPLGMNDTYFYLPKEKGMRLMMLHAEDRTRHTTNAPETLNVNGVMYRDYPNQDNGSFYSGGGGLVSTAYDYTVFLQCLLNEGEYNGKRLLSPHTVRMMTMNQIGDVRPVKFGLGFELIGDANKHRTLQSPGTYYWGGMFASTYWVDPQENLVAQFVLQQYPASHGELADKIKVAIYQALTN